MIRLWLGLSLIALDQLLKHLLLSFQPQIITYNTGTAFSLGNPSFLAIGLIALIIAAATLKAQPRTSWLILILAALSNIIDRLRFGAIIDYISLENISINLADGLILLCCLHILIVAYQKRPTP